MIIAKWSAGTGGIFNKADATLVANEISNIGASATPQQIVDAARDEQSELHKCFEWNDEVSAEKYRISQARKIVCSLIIEQPEKEKPDGIRVFYKTCNREGYKRTEFIMQNVDEYAMLLKRAKAELTSFSEKYKKLNEMQEIIEMIQKICA